ncbi:MAG: alpha/beta hydrolase [Chitinophaga sp.]|uniref:alpha/beta fold hydrolase n=1 Tax=Chitinophaga sp. TaxID=1869181 RepID=UPI001B247554|nr:alpha/beta hydrolase [Chitinophaga sp.]MBO9729948.1 alpha/beta hydrolase [Chitinophaga sp.]
MAKTNASPAQNTVANNDVKTDLGITFKNVKTQSVNIGGTDFYYRKLGDNNAGVPVIFLNHLGATMDNCDPRIMDGIASAHQIICFDNRGVGATKGKTPKTIAEMAKDARAFIHALGYEKVDLVGFSMGGFISQEILLQEPQLVRKAVITGTGPAGGEGIKNVTKITYTDILRGLFSFKDAKTYLFFNRNENGKKSAKEFLAHAWALQTPQDLSVIKQPVLVANGDNDRMVQSSNTHELSKRIPNSELIIYKDAGHGGMYQYHEAFVKSALAFLAK